MNARMIKQKGYTAEVQVVEWLESYGFTAERRRPEGFADRGDVTVHGNLEWVFEVKNYARADMPTHLTELLQEMANNGQDRGVLILKRAGSTNPDDWYFVQPGWLWVRDRVVPDRRLRPTQSAVFRERAEEALGRWQARFQARRQGRPRGA